MVPFLPPGAHPLCTPAPASARDALSEFEHWWKAPVQVVLFVFGLVNAGVPLTSRRRDAGRCERPDGREAVGIGVAMALAIAGRFPASGCFIWKDCRGRFAAAYRFTVALFFATAAFPAGPMLDQTKLGALLSLGGAIIALASRR